MNRREMLKVAGVAMAAPVACSEVAARRLPSRSNFRPKCGLCRIINTFRNHETGKRTSVGVFSYFDLSPEEQKDLGYYLHTTHYYSDMNGNLLSIKRFVSPGWVESHPKPTPPGKTEPCLGWFDDNSGAMSKKA